MYDEDGPLNVDVGVQEILATRSLCNGYQQGADTLSCVFSRHFPGSVAHPNGRRCVFCCPERMLAAVQDPKKKKILVSALNKFKEKNEAVHQLAVGRLRSHLSTEQFKAAVAPINLCIGGVGAQPCTRSLREDGGPAWAVIGTALCSSGQKDVPADDRNVPEARRATAGQRLRRRGRLSVPRWSKGDDESKLAKKRTYSREDSKKAKKVKTSLMDIESGCDSISSSCGEAIVELPVSEEA